MRLRSMVLAAALALVLASPLAAQEWRGKARIDGQVKNEKGEPVEGCVVKLRWGRSGRGGPDEKTDKKGKWAIFGLAGGPWDLDFEAPGYRPRQIGITLQEGGRNDTVQIVLEAAPQAAPRAGRRRRSSWAARRSRRRRPRRSRPAMPRCRRRTGRARARTTSRRSPSCRTTPALIERVAVAYLGEGNKDEALRYARMASEKAPADPQPWQIIAELEIERGNAEAGMAALDRVPAEKIIDPALYLNAGIILYNKKKLDEAVTAFDKAIAVKPDADRPLLPRPGRASAEEERRGEGRLSEGAGAGARRSRRQGHQGPPEVDPLAEAGLGPPLPRETPPTPDPSRSRR